MQSGEKTLCGKALARVRAKIEKTHILVELRLGLGQKIEKTPFLVGAWLK